MAVKVLTVYLLLVASCYAAEPNKQDEDKAAKRQLMEGNFGVRIQPSVETSFNPQGGANRNQNELREGSPQREYGQPKISDVLTGHDASFPAAIQSHLYSPVQVYQPKLGSPTTFEVSQPVPSPLAYSEHKIYQPSLMNTGSQVLNQQSRDQPLQLSPFPGFGQLQPPLPPRPDLPNEFLPRFDAQGQMDPLQQQQIYQQVFAEQSGQIPQDIYQQINQLSQMNFDASLQNSEALEQQGIQGPPGSNQQQEQTQQFGNRIPNSEQQGQIIEEQNRSSEQQSSTQQPQAVSYSSFSQSLPANYQSQYQSQIDHSMSSPEPPQPQQGLPQPQSPLIFQTTRAVRTQSVFQPIGTTTTSPQTTVYTTVNQTTRRIGILKIRNEPIPDDSTTPQSFTSSTIEPQGSSSTTSFVSSEEISQSTPSQEQTSSTRITTPTTRQRMAFRQFTRPNVTPRSTTQRSMFSSRPTFSPWLRRRTTLDRFSTLPTSTLSPTSVFIENSSTPSSQPTLETLSSLPPQPVVTSLSTLPPQPSILTSSILTSQPPIYRSPSTTPQPQRVQSTLTPIPLFTPEQITTSSLQPQFPTTLEPLQYSSTLQPVPVTQPQLLPSSVQPNAPNVTPFPALRLGYDIQSEPQSIIKIQETKEEKFSQQFSKPQLQYIQGPQQIQQQLQLIQQQLQLLQQQPFIQQQPRSVQNIQQQNSPFPQPIKLLQQQPISQQPVQLIQQEPQPQPSPGLRPVQSVQQQPQLTQQQPQSIPQQTQLIQEQPQLIQQQLQLIQQQPQSIEQQSQSIHQQPQLIQQQPQLIQQQPQLIQQQPQLIQQQPQLIQQQPQLIQQQPQLIQEQPQLVAPQPQLQLPQPGQPQLFQPQPQLIQEQPQLIQQQPQLIQTSQQAVQIVEQQPQLIQTATQSVQIVEQQPESQTTPQPVTLLQKPQPSPVPAKETQSNKQEQQNQNAQKEEQERQEINEVQKTIENEAYYNQLLHNNLYSEELYASLQQPLFPVPVGISSYPSASALHSSFPTAFTASPFTASPFSVTPLPLYSSHLHSPHLHSAHLHGSSFHGPYHSTHAFPSVQFFGKHANGIFGAGWKRKK